MYDNVSYDESHEYERYLHFNRWRLRTPFERRALELGAMRVKGTYDGPGSPSPSVQRSLLAIYDAEADKDIRLAIGEIFNDYLAFQKNVEARIDAEIASGRFKPNRCPACNRIVKTPEARQCLWCSHDWHDTIPTCTRI